MDVTEQVSETSVRWNSYPYNSVIIMQTNNILKLNIVFLLHHFIAFLGASSISAILHFGNVLIGTVQLTISVCLDPYSIYQYTISNHIKYCI